jgi:hypothetical protein
VTTIAANVLQHGLVAHHATPPWWLVAVLAAIPPTALVAVAHQVALLARPTAPSPLLEDSAAPVPGECGPAVAHGEAPVPGVMHPVGETTGDVGEELVDRARQLVTASPAPLGRRRLAKELDISEHQARQLLTHVTQTPGAVSTSSPSSSPFCSPAPSSPLPTRSPELNGVSHV